MRLPNNSRLVAQDTYIDKISGLRLNIQFKLKISAIIDGNENNRQNERYESYDRMQLYSFQINGLIYGVSKACMLEKRNVFTIMMSV